MKQRCLFIETVIGWEIRDVIERIKQIFRANRGNNDLIIFTVLYPNKITGIIPLNSDLLQRFCESQRYLHHDSLADSETSIPCMICSPQKDTEFSLINFYEAFRSWLLFEHQKMS